MKKAVYFECTWQLQNENMDVFVSKLNNIIQAYMVLTEDQRIPWNTDAGETDLIRQTLSSA